MTLLILQYFIIYSQFNGFTDTNGDCFYKLDLTIEWDRDDIAREVITAEEWNVRFSPKKV